MRTIVLEGTQWEKHDAVDEARVDVARARQKYMRKGRTREGLDRTHLLTHFLRTITVRFVGLLKPLPPPRGESLRGVGKLKADSFGKVVHMDHVFCGADTPGVNGESCALVILDQYTGFVMAYPMGRKTSEEVVKALRHFLGDVDPKNVSVRAANTHEYEAALKTLGIAYHRSTPYRHQSNGKIERCIRSIVDGARCALFQSGLGHPHWPYAIEHAAIMRNVYIPYHTHGETPWKVRMGDEFPWRDHPFGAKVRAIIRSESAKQRGKFEPSTSEALFLGWEFAPGFRHADYRIVHGNWADGGMNGELHMTRTIDLVGEREVVFPLGIGSDFGTKTDCLIRCVPIEYGNDRTMRMLAEGVTDEKGVLTDDQRMKGWTVDRFGERLVAVPPRSTRPSGFTPEGVAVIAPWCQA